MLKVDFFPSIHNDVVDGIPENYFPYYKRYLYEIEFFRDAFGKPIYVNSGYRSNFVNEAVGGVSNSQHKFGYAADISVSSRDSISELFALIQEMELPFDQVIYYRKAGFIHVSWSPTYRKQIIVRDA